MLWSAYYTNGVLDASVDYNRVCPQAAGSTQVTCTRK